jgi:hypothetical protein
VPPVVPAAIGGLGLVQDGADAGRRAAENEFPGTQHAADGAHFRALQTARRGQPARITPRSQLPIDEFQQIDDKLAGRGGVRKLATGQSVQQLLKATQ